MLIRIDTNTLIEHDSIISIQDESYLMRGNKMCDRLILSLKNGYVLAAEITYEDLKSLIGSAPC